MFRNTATVKQTYFVTGTCRTASSCNPNQNREEEDEKEVNTSKMTRASKGNLNVVEELYNQIPAFTDVFSEDTFYIFVVFFVMSTLLVAFILSKFITIKPVE